MFFLRESDPASLVLSPSDLHTASNCEFALLREFDHLLGRDARPPMPADPLLERTRALGMAHEQRELRRLVARHRGQLWQGRAAGRTAADLEQAAAETLHALADRSVEVVYQGCVFDGGFLGFPDFLVRGEDNTWQVVDTKLSRHASVAALLQIAAYADHLSLVGIAINPTARLVLGSLEVSDHPVHELVPVYRLRRERLAKLVQTHSSGVDRVQLDQPDLLVCGECAACTAELGERADVWLVAGVNASQRKLLAEAGVRTIADLAARHDPVAQLRPERLEALRHQAQLQMETAEHPTQPAFAVTDPTPIALLPPPAAGDVFFDFEGDPLWHEPQERQWGLEYLFGLVEVDTGQPVFRAWWAHDRVGEKQALVDFIEYITQRRRLFPGMHIYHYADYERAALLRLAARHAVAEEQVDALLRQGVLVDLFATVRSSLRVGQSSYSIKKLEPLYMGSTVRDAQGVTAGAESIVEYHEYCEAVLVADEVAAAKQLERIRDYNEYDCISTWRLQEWLRSLAPAPEQHPPDPGERAADPVGEHPLEVELRAPLAGVRVADRSPEQQAIALAAAAVQYHRRENKPFWWRHFERLRLPPSTWQGDGCFVIDAASVVSDWAVPPGKRTAVRALRLTGHSPGTPLEVGSAVTAIYGPVAPPDLLAGPGHLNVECPGQVNIVEIEEAQSPDGQPTHEWLVEQRLGSKMAWHHELPVGLAVTDVIKTQAIDAAIQAVCRQIDAATATVPAQPGLDVLARRPPRLRTLPGLPSVELPAWAEARDPDYVGAITTAVADLDRSVLAVQGPPGTGKTHVGSRVIAKLVARGWKIGVTSQSHAAIEHLLDAAVEAGVSAQAVGKHSHATHRPTWTDLPKADGLAAFIANQPAGCLIGGTAWDLCNPKRIAVGQLDLVVVEEAGQFSLANTLAVSSAGQRLLLLGDPQQLPQVSQGSHPERIDESALSWLLDGEATIPVGYGYFLEATWRMHPALASKVSHLAYGGRLHSRTGVDGARQLIGIPAGIHAVTVAHRGNATSSPEEAQAVVDLVDDLIGRQWREGATQRVLDAHDIIVLTPYNGQRRLLRDALDARGFPEVLVGTVDKFQGREAPVAILSMTASSPHEAPRGMGFVLDRHRLNVAVSRAQWAAFIVASPALTDIAPRNPSELRALGAYLWLTVPTASKANPLAPSEPGS